MAKLRIGADGFVARIGDMDAPHDALILRRLQEREVLQRDVFMTAALAGVGPIEHDGQDLQINTSLSDGSEPRVNPGRGNHELFYLFEPRAYFSEPTRRRRWFLPDGPTTPYGLFNTNAADQIISQGYTLMRGRGFMVHLDPARFGFGATIRDAHQVYQEALKLHNVNMQMPGNVGAGASNAPSFNNSNREFQYVNINSRPTTDKRVGAAAAMFLIFDALGFLAQFFNRDTLTVGFTLYSKPGCEHLAIARLLAMPSPFHAFAGLNGNNPRSLYRLFSRDERFLRFVLWDSGGYWRFIARHFHQFFPTPSLEPLLRTPNFNPDDVPGNSPEERAIQHHFNLRRYDIHISIDSAHSSHTAQHYVVVPKRAASEVSAFRASNPETIAHEPENLGHEDWFGTTQIIQLNDRLLVYDRVDEVYLRDITFEVFGMILPLTNDDEFLNEVNNIAAQYNLQLAYPDIH